MDIERRFLTNSVHLERRAAENGSTECIASGHAIVFNSLSEELGFWEPFRERIMPGALDNVVNGDSDIFALHNHRTDAVLGRTTAQTLSLRVDERGLYFECTLPDTQVGRDLATSIERGDLTGNSFGFTIATGGQRWLEQEDGTYIREVTQIESLPEISLGVTFPAYSATDIDVAQRSLKQAREERDSVLSKHLSLRHMRQRKLRLMALNN